MIYFGFFCFEPKIWPEKPPKDCNMPFTLITAVYAGIILCFIMPFRIVLNKKQDRDPNLVNWYYAFLTVIHMFFCLGWLIFALVELKYSSKPCWDPFTW